MKRAGERVCERAVAAVICLLAMIYLVTAPAFAIDSLNDPIFKMKFDFGLSQPQSSLNVQEIKPITIDQPGPLNDPFFGVKYTAGLYGQQAGINMQNSYIGQIGGLHSPNAGAEIRDFAFGQAIDKFVVPDVEPIKMTWGMGTMAIDGIALGTETMYRSALSAQALDPPKFINTYYDGVLSGHNKVTFNDLSTNEYWHNVNLLGTNAITTHQDVMTIPGGSYSRIDVFSQPMTGMDSWMMQRYPLGSPVDPTMPYTHTIDIQSSFTISTHNGYPTTGIDSWSTLKQPTDLIGGSNLIKPPMVGTSGSSFNIYNPGSPSPINYYSGYYGQPSGISGGIGGSGTSGIGSYGGIGGGFGNGIGGLGSAGGIGGGLSGSGISGGGFTGFGGGLGGGSGFSGGF